VLDRVRSGRALPGCALPGCERFAAAECGGAVSAEVVMVDFSGLEVVARS